MGLGLWWQKTERAPTVIPNLLCDRWVCTSTTSTTCITSCLRVCAEASLRSRGLFPDKTQCGKGSEWQALPRRHRTSLTHDGGQGLPDSLASPSSACSMIYDAPVSLCLQDDTQITEHWLCQPVCPLPHVLSHRLIKSFPIESQIKSFYELLSHWIKPFSIESYFCGWFSEIPTNTF